MVNPFRPRPTNGPAQAGLLREQPDEPLHLLPDRKQLGLVRLGRWSKLLGSFPPARREILLWAEQMAAVNGPKVQVWENVVDWITALYIVRYGENEAYWPEQLSAADVHRAQRWQLGETPYGVKGVNQ